MSFAVLPSIRAGTALVLSTGERITMRLPPPIDQEDFYGNLLNACREEAERAVCMLLWRTGMHASTLCEGTWAFGSFTEHTIYWDRPKTGRAMQAHVTAAEHKLISRCITAGSLPTTQRALRWRLASIGKRAGYPGITPLTLRHSRAIYLLDQGRAVNRVASLMGCSWQVLERHYAVIENAREVSK